MSLLLILAAAAAAASPVQLAPMPASRVEVRANSAAMSLFEKDWVLMGWALKRHDRDGDRQLAPAEAAGAADEFREIADGDGDGRVSRLEYRQAREFIVARY